MDIATILFYLVGLALILLFGRLLVVPFKVLMRLLLNGIMGGIVLFLFNLVGGIFNLYLEISPLNAIIVGFLGVPGVILLLIVQMIL